MKARAVIREDMAWVCVGQWGARDRWPQSPKDSPVSVDPTWQWATAIDVIDQFGIVMDTVYVAPTEKWEPGQYKWEPERYQDALMHTGWEITSGWEADRFATVRPVLINDDDDDEIDLDRAYKVVQQLRSILRRNSDQDKLARELQSIIELEIERQADAYLTAQDQREGPIARDD